MQPSLTFNIYTYIYICNIEILHIEIYIVFQFCSANAFLYFSNQASNFLEHVEI